MAHQHAVPNSHLTQIGDITVPFAMLESGLQSLVHTLLGLDQRVGQTITAELAFKAIRTLAKTLYRLRFDEDARREEFCQLIKKAAKLEEMRNQITHSVWRAGANRELITRIKVTAKKRQGMHHHFEEVTAENLAALANDIRVLAEKIQFFFVDAERQ